MPRGRHRHSPPLHRILPPSVVAGVSIVCAGSAWLLAQPLVLRGLVTVTAVAAITGAYLMRSWDQAAGRRVAELEHARASDEWKADERLAELESELEESRELRVRLETKLRRKRVELAGLRGEHAALLRRYATAETERASALEGRRQLALEAAAEPPELPVTSGAPTPGAYLRAAQALQDLTRNGVLQEALRVAEQARKRDRAEQARERKAGDRAPERAAAEQAGERKADKRAPERGAGDQGRERKASERVPDRKAGDQSREPKADDRAREPKSGEQAPERGADEPKGKHAAGAGPVEEQHHRPPSALTPALPVAPALAALPARRASAVVPYSTARRHSVPQGSFDFFGTQKANAVIEAVQNEDLADVVGEEALAAHRTGATVDHVVGKVIDLTAHDETEPLDVVELRRSAIS
ncbi:hypothetical protein PZB75_12715 [Streptomyces sp. AM 4-1-1]|uniref:hypothetical protein n=1 Tax=Streptomyces sp. AM 4-1-1 TaxID=3028710 RepID=UPI0023B9481F|nr:hypothetical protein [Streptomyces sp. AM 4-1-1]WEH34149.1 hypothetical protein PZB75_12715 [Streptomyces sp. AM 4-1-1]